jgi:hypothetical protein
MKPSYEVQVKWAEMPDRWVLRFTTKDERSALDDYDYYRDCKPTAIAVRIVKIESKVIAECAK